MMHYIPCLAAALLWAVLLSHPSNAGATTFVLMQPEDLAARSTAVIQGVVVAKDVAVTTAGNAVGNDVLIEPSEVIAGSIPEDEVVLRDIGGDGPGARQVFGAAQYAVGEEVVVFVERRSDTTLRTVAMAMGKYSLSHFGERILATREMGEGIALFDDRTGAFVTSGGVDALELRDLVRRVRAAGNAGERGPRATVAVEGGAGRVRDLFTFMGTPSRWFEPDAGAGVRFKLDPAGAAGIGSQGSRMAIEEAVAAWSSVPTSGLSLSCDGDVDAEVQPFAECSGRNSVVFDDPFDEITDPVDCKGVVAIGGFCTGGGTRWVRGTVFRRISEGQVTFNNGFENCPFWNACNLAEIATHELGHAVGLGHSQFSDATMAPVAHLDGRCAAVMGDDVAGVTFSYPPVTPYTATPTPAPTLSPISTPTPGRRRPLPSPLPPCTKGTFDTLRRRPRYGMRFPCDPAGSVVAPPTSTPLLGRGGGEEPVKRRKPTRVPQTKIPRRPGDIPKPLRPSR